jgi:hypothetical protein
MNFMKKIVLGLGIASGAALAAYLLTGERVQRTKNYVVRRVRPQKDITDTQPKKAFDDSEVHYI